jgi:hypothetical protein
MDDNSIANTGARCTASTKGGGRCRNNAIPGTKFCYISSHGDIPKTLGQRSRNFARNNWLALFLTALPLAFAIHWEI